MKKLLLILAVSGLFIACAGGAPKTETQEQQEQSAGDQEEVPTETPTETPAE